MWLLNALRRVTFPEPVTLKRLQAARLLFILGISPPLFSPPPDGPALPYHHTRRSDGPPLPTPISVVLRMLRSPSARPPVYLGASTIVMLRPSSFGSTSTLAISRNSSKTLANTS